MKFRNWLVRAISTATVGLALTSVNAYGLVLWSTAPPSVNLADGVQADAVAGSFSEGLGGPSGGVTIDKITFWGFYGDTNSDPLPASNSPFTDAFAITFNGTDVVSTASLTKSVETSIGTDLLTLYELSFSPMTFLSAPTTLDIVNNFNDGSSSATSFDAEWYWQGVANNGARAYQIEGARLQQIPEPGTLLLFGLALAALGLSSRRKHVGF